MAKKLKVRRIGNSLGVILPKEILEQLRVEEGDGLDYSASKDGVRLFATNPDFAKAMPKSI